MTDEGPAIDAMARLRALYPNVMGVEYDNARTRAAGLQAGEAAPEDGEALPLELFGEFFERQNGRPLSEAQEGTVIDELERAGVR